MEKEDLLYRYFSNTLTEDERLQFEELLKTDAAFKAEVDVEMKVRNASIHEKNEALRDKLTSFEARIATREEKKSKPSHLKIAAALLFLIAASWFVYQSTQSPDFDSLYAQNFEVYPNASYVITRGDTVNTPEREAFVAYETGDYETAFAKMQIIEQKSHTSFYKAQALLQLGRDAEAQGLLQATVTANQNFTAESLWYLAGLEIKKENKAEAKKYLNQLLQKGTYKKAAAQELIKELD